MANIVYLEVHSSQIDYQKSLSLKLPLESFVTYCIYKYCCPVEVTVKFVTVNETRLENELFFHCGDGLDFADSVNIPWQVSSCVFPVVLYDDTIITGLCAVARHICKYRSLPPAIQEHEEGLLGFRKSCLQAPNEVSIWTKFCEVDLVKSVKMILSTENIQEVPVNLVRFENHLSKPIRVHNVYKIARGMKKDNMKNKKDNENDFKGNKTKQVREQTRVPKTRKWKSNKSKELEVDSSTKIEDLALSHQFAEGPFLTLADLVLLPLYHILIKSFEKSTFASLLPLTFKWFTNITQIPEMESIMKLLNGLKYKPPTLKSVCVPKAEDVSLYKCDPKRHNPKKRLFTKEDDIEKALSSLMDGMELEMSSNMELIENEINWNNIPDGANPSSGHLPDDRMARKSQQLENLTLAVLSVAKDGDLIVDFCSGSGHLGILIAYLLPKSTVILLENKEQSLLRARTRVHQMKMKNVYFFQCNLDFFIGKFDIGLALHACGIASDLVLDKCLKTNAKFVLCPCCYGSLHATDRLVYPRSSKFSSVGIDQYLCIGHAADQTHEDHPMTARGARCMAVIDSDRARLAQEFGYKVTLSRLKPLSCTPKNNLIIGVPL